jgi:UDP-3-O-[3-hydroxymyristoyl] N-acetylglucosamine deacetylase
MIDHFQRTLKKSVHFSGVGLHSGISANLTVSPAEVGSGISFRRVDQGDGPTIKASWDTISITDLSTSIGFGDHRISTIEHLMAALAGLGIVNAEIQIDGPEVPILDGSAKNFVESFEQTGVLVQDQCRKIYKIQKPFLYEEGEKAIKLEPADMTEYRCTISFSDSIIGRQTIIYRHSIRAFMELATARTFCHYRDIDAMRRAGLAMGGSLENAVVVTDEGVMNPEGLQGGDEFVRHKLLDAIGDLSLIGAPLAGKISLYKTGHGVHARFMKLLMEERKDVIELLDQPQ